MAAIVNNNQDRTCAICLEDIPHNNQLALRCNHLFHGDCLDLWREAHNTCPTCRAEIDPNRVMGPLNHEQAMQFQYRLQALVFQRQQEEAIEAVRYMDTMRVTRSMTRAAENGDENMRQNIEAINGLAENRENRIHRPVNQHLNAFR